MEGQDYTTCLLMSVVPDTNMEPAAGAGLDFSSPVVDAAFRHPEEKDKPMPASPGSPCGEHRAILVISVMFGVSFLVCLVFLSRAFVNSVEDAKKDREKLKNLTDLQNMGLEDAKKDWEKMKKDLTDLQNVGLEDAKKDHEKMKKDLTDLQNMVTKDQADAKKERQQIQADLKTGLADLHNETDAICQACPSGWERFEQSCYFYSKTTQPWQTARDGCINLASHLAIITDSKEQTFLKTKYTSQLYWIGLSDQSKEGDWFWVDGSKPAFFSWSPGQPDNHGEEDCVVMEPTGLWHDYGCSYTTHWICEKTWTC